MDRTDPTHTRLTVGGDIINYPGHCGTPTLELTTVKLLINKIVSTLNAKFIKTDIKDFYLNTPMAQNKYMCLKISNLPKIMVQHYNLVEKTTRDRYVYVEIKRAMYWLPQAGLMAPQLLEK